MVTPPYFTDAEVANMCEGLTQPAAMVRHLRKLGLKVDRKPNGKPLAWRPAPAADPAAQNAASGPNIVGLKAWAQQRGQRGQKTQGR